GGFVAVDGDSAVGCGHGGHRGHDGHCGLSRLLMFVRVKPLNTTSPQAVPPTEPPAAHTRKLVWHLVDYQVAFTFICFGLASSLFGSVMVSTPSLNSALIFAASTYRGDIKAAHDFTIVPLDSMIILRSVFSSNLRSPCMVSRLNALTRAPFSLRSPR